MWHHLPTLCSKATLNSVCQNPDLLFLQQFLLFELSPLNFYIYQLMPVKVNLPTQNVSFQAQGHLHLLSPSLVFPRANNAKLPAKQICLKYVDLSPPLQIKGSPVFFFTYDCSGWGVSSGHVCALQRPSVSVCLTASFSLTHPFSAAQPVPLKVVLLALFCSTATCDASPSPGWTQSSEQGALASASSSGPKKGAEVLYSCPFLLSAWEAFPG